MKKIIPIILALFILSIDSFGQIKDSKKNDPKNSKIIDGLPAYYNNVATKNTSFIYINVRQLKTYLETFPNDDPSASLIIKFSLIYNSKIPTLPERLKHRRNVLNLLFYRYFEGAESDDLYIYDMNELCPPGNCFGCEVISD